MAQKKTPPQLQPSVWDRLTSPPSPPGASIETEIARIKDSVRRDLEWVLNTHRAPLHIPEELEHLQRSLLTYGLPDFTGASINGVASHDRLRLLIEATVRHFEPRLADIQVSLETRENSHRKAELHYRIDAWLRVQPVPRPVSFDTVLELSNRSFDVKSEG